jgi:hypothetical protein
VWAEAAKWLAKFPEAVVTAVDAEGYPVSIRETAPRYNAETGQMSIAWPDGVAVAEGPATVVCHSHDEKVWNIKAMQIKGRLERRTADWVFTSTAFTPPSGMLITFWRLSKNGRAAAKRYLDKRGLPPPVVNWGAIDELWRRARAGRT